MHAPPGSSSYVSGTSDRPLVYRTVDEVLRGAAMEMPERRAVVAVHQEISYSFAEFDREVERTAQGMAACGLRRESASASGRRTGWNGCSLCSPPPGPG